MRLRHMAVIIGICYGTMAILPLFVGDIRFIMNIMIMCLIWAVVASCWDLIMGFAGIFSFGQVAFFVMGAYCSGILAIEHHVPPVLAILLAGGFTAVMGVLVGLPCLKLAGPYIALVTFGVHMALQPTLRGKIGIALGSGGSVGLLTIPPVSLFGYTFSSANMIPTFYLTLLLSLACVLVIMFAIKSHWGVAFLALKDSQDFAMSLGISAFKYKLMVFALTSFLTGIIGAYYGHFYGVLSYRMLDLDLFSILMVMMLVGGLGHFPGAVFGAFLVVAGSELMAPLGAYRAVTMGALVVILVLALPNGVMGLFMGRPKRISAG
ncbi:MAG: branched-chain amino acid ABC transporter permease [Desulfobacterales bacterium]|nr:branched-chain amino acid ABC transporter permease [Desulfobacterales bacterium]MDJ0853852.1 branched-chain amino acid ABC transporter permease [Desulfobacterales bacterium]MDJ0887882.1 branched-chain amino acid ABC transporter permease [Desulfobacterales bacterium]MDJ0990934.1 branched-chain amino acid ABC transporter permease [Desulfobacterales bacterium]